MAMILKYLPKSNVAICFNWPLFGKLSRNNLIAPEVKCCNGFDLSNKYSPFRCFIFPFTIAICFAKRIMVPNAEGKPKKNRQRKLTET